MPSYILTPVLQYTLHFTLTTHTLLLTIIICMPLKALDAALKLIKSKAPNTAAMLFSVDRDNNKIICLCIVPNVSECNTCTLLGS